jgi:hypothetical protein
MNYLKKHLHLMLFIAGCIGIFLQQWLFETQKFSGWSYYWYGVGIFMCWWWERFE